MGNAIGTPIIMLLHTFHLRVYTHKTKKCQLGGLVMLHVPSPVFISDRQPVSRDLEKQSRSKRLAARGDMKKAFGLAKVHGDHKGLDAAIIKATSYDHVLPKEKHIRTIFQFLSPYKARSEVIYCIDGLAKRLSQTNNWAVALKTLIVIHRAMRELDHSVWQELVNYSRGRGYMINLAQFSDSFSPNALDYSAWVRNYALYLEERLRCFVMVKYDVGTYNAKYSKKHDTQDLLHQLPALQNLLFRLLDCKPGSAAGYNRLIQYALSVVAGESIKLYVAITVRVVELLDKFFEMNRNDAISALEIYQKSGSQAERLSEFFETCKGLEFGRGQKFINIKKPPASFMTTMEEYIKEAPTTLMLEYNVDADDKRGTTNDNTAPVGDLLSEVNHDTNVEDKSDPSPKKNETTTPPQAAELMGLNDLLTGASEFDENSLALAIVPTENSLNFGNDDNDENPVTGWEVALFTEPESSNEIVVANSTEASGLDVSKLDSLYDEVNAGTQQHGAYHASQTASNPFDFESGHGSQHNIALAPPTFQNAYYAYPNMASPIPTQMVGLPYQDYYMMQQQQQQEPFVMNKKSINPFDEPNILPEGMLSHPTESNHSSIM